MKTAAENELSLKTLTAYKRCFETRLPKLTIADPSDFHASLPQFVLSKLIFNELCVASVLQTEGLHPPDICMLTV